ncbi:MAG: hypothetical protein R3A51_21545 [Nannocystaceae bacterium]|nr:hypothetical protein [Myxococcales bacterium]
MRSRVSLSLALVLCALVGCRGSQPSERPERDEVAGPGAAPVEPEAGDPPLPPSPDAASPEGDHELTGETGIPSPSGCVADCQRRDMMKAVGWEQIERDCQAECRGDDEAAATDP